MKNVRSEAARKANQTRAARRAFYETYPRTAAAAEQILRGQSHDYRSWSTAVTADVNFAAVKANLNRYGQYSEMAYACNW